MQAMIEVDIVLRMLALPSLMEFWSWPAQAAASKTATLQRFPVILNHLPSLSGRGRACPGHLDYSCSVLKRSGAQGQARRRQRDVMLPLLGRGEGLGGSCSEVDAGEVAPSLTSPDSEGGERWLWRVATVAAAMLRQVLRATLLGWYERRPDRAHRTLAGS